MNEEEKEAIETFKHWIKYEKNNKEKINKADELINMQECILGIIDKQQKEIADLKMQNHIIRDMNLTVRLSEEVFDETYIRKDKIKEKIEKLKQYKEEIKEEKDFEYFTTLRIIKALRELLVSGQESD